MLPASYQGEAFNPVPDSENRIHSDEVAQSFGFEGALVPGVTVSAYLAEPAVVAWGLPWLERGRARVSVKKPLYDRRGFRVEVSDASERAYEAELVEAAGTSCAVGRFELPDRLPDPPARRGAAPVTGEPPPATREGLEELRRRGTFGAKVVWGAGVPMTSYRRDASALPELLRLDGGGFANTSFVLGMTNWILAANVALGPWVHLETESQHYRAVPNGSELFVEAAIVDLFEKKGHEFVDLDVAAFLPEDVPVLGARLRAIYRLRGA